MTKESGQTGTGKTTLAGKVAEAILMGSEELSGDLLAQRPDVDGTDAVQRHVEKVAEERATWATWTDRFGRHFDGDRHESDPRTGEPVRTKDGNLKIRRKAPRPSTGPQGVQATASTPAGPVLPDATELATVTVETLTGMAAMLLGEQWRVEDTEASPERSTMIQAWAAYYRSKGITAIKPEIWVGLVMASYVAPRASHPKTRERFKGWFRGKRGRIAEWWKDRKNARADHRADGDRQNQLGDEARGGLQESEDPFHRP
jgi:hypothetical protein